MLIVLSTFLLLLTSVASTFTVAGLDDFPINQRLFSATEHRQTVHRLSRPLVGDDGRIYACSERNLLAFESDGTIAWTIHLNYTCNGDIAPVRGDNGKIYLVAENRVLKVEPTGSVSSDAAGEIFFAPEPGQGEPSEIIGISVSRLSSAVYISTKNLGLFAYGFHGQRLWNVGPVLDQHGYLLGCRKSPENCYFNSLPVIDHCEATIYILNTEGEIYSLSTRNPHFTWIQDLSSFGKTFTITAGNNGHLYVTVPVRALVLALDVSTGNVLWQKTVGPLNTLDCRPVVDSNGFVSVGSLDGWLYSISSTGIVKKFSPKGTSESVIKVGPVLDCSGYAVYMSQTHVERKISQTVGGYTYISASTPKNAVVALLVPETGSIYWSETYSDLPSSLAETDLRHFLIDERILLAFVAAARIGNPLTCRSNWQKLVSSCSKARTRHPSIYTGDEKPIIWFLVFESAVLVVLAVMVRFCLIFWRKKKLRGDDLGSFLRKRQSLLYKKKVFDRTITELKQKATDEAVSNDVLEELGNLVQGRDTIKRKLSTTYSLGRDQVSSRSKYSLPLYGDGKMRSYSFQDTRKGNVTIFQAMSDSSSAEMTASSSSSTIQTSTSSREDNIIPKAKGKGLIIQEESPISDSSSSSSDGGSSWERYPGSPSKPGKSGDRRPHHEMREELGEEGGMVDSQCSSRKSVWLRRRTLSSTN